MSRDLSLLHPDLQSLCKQWLQQCKDSGIHVIVTNTYRSQEEQDALYAQGRTAPGKIVTNAKGGKSEHNFTLDDGTPASKAFDFAVEDKNGQLNWNVNSIEWSEVVSIGQQLGLVWGGGWKSIKDFDHWQLA